MIFRKAVKYERYPSKTVGIAAKAQAARGFVRWDAGCHGARLERVGKGLGGMSWLPAPPPRPAGRLAGSPPSPAGCPRGPALVTVPFSSGKRSSMAGWAGCAFLLLYLVAWWLCRAGSSMEL